MQDMEVAVTALSGVLIYRHVHFLRKHLKGHLYLVVRKLRNPEAHAPRSPANRAGGSGVLGREQARSDHHPDVNAPLQVWGPRSAPQRKACLALTPEKLL